MDMTIPFNEIFSEEKQSEKVFIKVLDKQICVKQYLPINEKLQLMSNILTDLVNDSDYNFINPIHLKVYTAIHLVEAYTNIKFDENDLPQIIYDKLIQNGIYTAIIKAIPDNEYNFIMEGINSTVESYYTHKNSIFGILDSIGKDYSNLDYNTKEIEKKMDQIGKSENLTLLKDVMNKLG